MADKLLITKVVIPSLALKAILSKPSFAVPRIVPLKISLFEVGLVPIASRAASSTPPSCART